jgi:hypothetical protein
MFDIEEGIWMRPPDLPALTDGAGIAFHNDILFIYKVVLVLFLIVLLQVHTEMSLK